MPDGATSSGLRMPIPVRKVSPLLSIRVVIKTLHSVCVIFNTNPEESQGIQPCY
ncbi:hypothetical protein HMPREF0208_02234 [Citrobacter koseri]|uniref:Uncharacterized protein n=1 Tax=Citrobacter koseri (strain ATCC BAA-895 / CDC 4225-83 / SGSC4696) TaxID=290338 RepID=A8AG81_CITK8|nr:hypothetical protein CKO_01357 [Citrobacter koseri ATCC BAA-895]KXB44047.1 hypothetical protein HMPREF0208_02234 [Citrobacter koseri]